MIEVNNIFKGFGDKEVLKGISGVFEKGITNLIIGKSGSGKTVLLKTMLGLHVPDQGSVIFDNQDFFSLNRFEQLKLRQDIGMVFQGSALFDSMTVEDNVMFPLTMLTDREHDEKMERVNFVLNRVNLVNVNNYYPSELSGGMKKRVAIARAIVMNPKYLFCDEPNSGLDPKTAMVIDNLIMEITDEYQMTTIINTHDMNSVMEIGEKIIMIEEGHKVWEGDMEEILKTDDETVVNFVFSSNLFKKIRKNSLKK